MPYKIVCGVKILQNKTKQKDTNEVNEASEVK